MGAQQDDLNKDFEDKVDNEVLQYLDFLQNYQMLKEEKNIDMFESMPDGAFEKEKTPEAPGEKGNE